MTQPTSISFDEWTLHRDIGALECNGVRVPLQEMPLQILDELASRPGELVTRDQLVARLWPKGVVDFDANLNTAVKKLRVALNDDPDKPRYIETAPRKGYRFIGRISVAATKASPTKKPVRKVLAIASALIVVVAIGIAIAMSLMKPVALPAQHLRLAIMPFENLSPDPANAFFADGMHEEILTTLANRSTNFDVISRTTMMSYKGKSPTATEVAKALNVTHVLEGSVRREGQTVRVTLQLIDARNDRHLWAQNYDRQLVNAMTLQSQVAEAVASQLLVKLASDNGVLRPSSNPEAYDLYLKAKLLSQKLRMDAALQEYQQTEDWLNRAIALDPTFAGAYLERSAVRMGKFSFSVDLSERNLQSAHSDLEMVRKLAGDVPSVLVAEGDYALYVEWDADQALRLVETPQVVASTDSYVMTRRAVILGFARRLDESFALFARAAELDPGNMNVLGPRLAFLWTARRPAQALQARRAYQRQLPRTLPWGELVFAYTGKLDEWNDDVNHDDDSIDIGARLSRRVQWLRFQNRIAEAIDAIERADLKMIRSGGVGGVRNTGVGRRPVAELHGWAKLLARDAVGAARDGQIMLDFAEHEPVTKWNSWYLRFIAAEGALFSGNKTQAIADARAVLTMTPGDRIPFMRLYANATAAQIFAWAGAEDEAVALLEELSKGFPGLGPAAITRDPLYSIPLKNNARYKALEKKLEAEIAENRKLL